MSDKDRQKKDGERKDKKNQRQREAVAARKTNDAGEARKDLKSSTRDQNSRRGQSA